MKLREALPSIFRRPLPLLERGTRMLVAGTLLDAPRRDVLIIVASVEGKLRFLSERGRYLAFSGYPLLTRLLETDARASYKFLFEPCERASLSLRPVASNVEFATVIEEYARTKFGWVMVEESGRYAVAALRDLIPLYRSDILVTDLSIRDVASPKIFSLPANTVLKKALQEMIRRRIRRVFLSGKHDAFVSDREILTHIFSPERLPLVRDSPNKMFDATLADVGAVEPIEVDGRTSIREISGLFRPESGAWCVVCPSGLVTPWDLVVKPFEMGHLTIRETVSARVRKSGRLVK